MSYLQLPSVPQEVFFMGHRIDAIPEELKPTFWTYIGLDSTDEHTQDEVRSAVIAAMLAEMHSIGMWKYRMTQTYCVEHIPTFKRSWLSRLFGG